jgi:FkbM family methyltransferase
MNYELATYYLNNKIEFMEEAGHEKLLIELKTHINPILTVKNTKIIGIDVGCCVGDYIKNIDEICVEKDREILCFEPNPINITKLEPIVNNYDNVKLFKCCLSNETGITSFYNWRDTENNNPGNQIAGLRGGGQKICDVEVKKLDNVLFERYGFDDILIKFIKIDTEGNDTNVIKGFEKYLSKTQYIIFECSNCLDDHRGPGIKNPMKDIVDFLSKNGFDTYRIGTKKLIKVNDEYWNQIYEDVKFWSNCFSLKKDDSLISKLIDENFNYIT